MGFFVGWELHGTLLREALARHDLIAQQCAPSSPDFRDDINADRHINNQDVQAARNHRGQPIQ